MSVVYLVSSGSYSSYGIEAVFDDRALAEAYVAEREGGEIGIEEYELNPNADNIRAGIRTHSVRLDRAGNLISHWQSYGVFTEPDRVGYSYRTFSPRIEGKAHYFEAYVVAKTKEQAIKAANERRAIWIAAGKEWPADE